MAETDRQRLERLTREKAEERARAAAWKLQQDAERRQKRESEVAKDRALSEELLAWCRETFAGYKLPTGHELGVESIPSDVVMESGVPEAPWVSIFVEHWGDEAGSQPRRVSILNAWHFGGYYVFKSVDASSQVDDLSQFKTMLVDAIAEIDQEHMRRRFNQIPSMRPRLLSRSSRLSTPR